MTKTANARISCHACDLLSACYPARKTSLSSFLAGLKLYYEPNHNRNKQNSYSLPFAPSLADIPEQQECLLLYQQSHSYILTNLVYYCRTGQPTIRSAQSAFLAPDLMG
jgi:hypothetical protein